MSPPQALDDHNRHMSQLQSRVLSSENSISMGSSQKLDLQTISSPPYKIENNINKVESVLPSFQKS